MRAASRGGTDIGSGALVPRKLVKLDIDASD
jgi:hypothetical protein